MNFSDSQFHKIFADAVSILQDAQVTKINWKAKGRLVVGLAALFLISTVSALIYFFVTRKIGPLMINVACCIPVLCFALIQQSRHIQIIENEFTEYRTAVGDMTDHLRDNLEEGILDDTMRQLIDIAQKEGDDVIKAFLDIKDESDGVINDMMGTVAESVISTAQANIIQRTRAMADPDAPDEDLSVTV